MPDPSEPLPEGGLTALELAHVLAELSAELRGLEVTDAVLFAQRDDLLLFVGPEGGRRALHVAPGGRRARVCTTRRRYPRDAFATGPRPDRVAELLRGRTVDGFDQPAGERRFALNLSGPVEPVVLEVELFGNRGLWALRTPMGEILALSRLPNVAGRTLRPGAAYVPPPSRPAAAEPPPRFVAPWSESIDRAFTALDRRDEECSARDELDRALHRELARRRARVQGLEHQRAQMDDAAAVRLMADMLLAYGSSLPPGATELRVADPTRDGAEIVVPRDLAVPPHVQARALYKRARKHEDGREACEHQIAEARAALEDLEPLRETLEHAADPAALADVRRALEQRGIVRPVRPPQPDAAERKLRKVTGDDNFRRFHSAEDMLILVGRDDRQNDRLATRIARGNDLWLHVGRGYAGSHVVVRVPKGKTASLETLLDAATLAVHFSKVRGASLEEVIYTHAKNVKKAKGMPPGKVLAARTRSLRVRLEPERLQRLLSTSDPTPR